METHQPERRRVPRASMQASGHIVTPAGLRYPFRTRDLSPGGCSAQLDVNPPLEGNESLWVHIEDLFSARARVAWAFSEGANDTQLGLVFEQFDFSR